MYMKLLELLEKHSPKPLKINYFELEAKREVVVTEVGVVMQVESVHLGVPRGSYELSKWDRCCSKFLQQYCRNFAPFSVPTERE